MASTNPIELNAQMMDRAKTATQVSLAAGVISAATALFLSLYFPQAEVGSLVAACTVVSGAFLLMAAYLGLHLMKKMEKSASMVASLALIILGTVAGLLSGYFTHHPIFTAVGAPLVLAGLVGVVRSLVQESRYHESQRQAFNREVVQIVEGQLVDQLCVQYPVWLNERDETGLLPLEKAITAKNWSAFDRMLGLGAKAAYVCWSAFVDTAIEQDDGDTIKNIHERNPFAIDRALLWKATDKRNAYKAIEECLSKLIAPHKNNTTSPS